MTPTLFLVPAALVLLAAAPAEAPKPAAPAAASAPVAKPATTAPTPQAPALKSNDVLMFGGGVDRNMTDTEKNVPTSWDPATGENVKWVVQLGSQTYAGPIVAGGKVYVGTNNEALKNPKLAGDRGNIMAFDAATGELVWQSAHAKLAAGRVNDWPLQGICSTPAIQGDRIYYVSNRAEVVAADTEGFRDGENDGPFTGEAESSPIDEDVLWRFDMIGELDVFPHNLAAGNPLLVDGILYTTTGNGVDEGHINIPATQAPSFIALDVATGKLVWESAMPSAKVFHGTWSNAAYGVVKGRPMVVFGGGDGWVYAFEPKTGNLLWKFDGNPKGAVYELGGAGTANEIIATPVIWQDKVYVGVGQDPEHGEAPGHFWAIDATLEGDVTEKGKIWHYGEDDFGRSISTAAITDDGLLFIADLSGYLSALDAKTGKLHWKYNTFAAVWGSPYVTDGKVFLGDEDGDVVILEASTTMKKIAEINMGSSVYTTPWAEDGVLYIASRTKLFAIQQGAKSEPPGKAKPAAAPSGEHR